MAVMINNKCSFTVLHNRIHPFPLCVPLYHRVAVWVPWQPVSHWSRWFPHVPPSLPLILKQNKNPPAVQRDLCQCWNPSTNQCVSNSEYFFLTWCYFLLFMASKSDCKSKLDSIWRLQGFNRWPHAAHLNGMWWWTCVVTGCGLMRSPPFKI